MPRLSVITFFLNEARNLPRLKEQLLSVLGQSDVETEFVLVDDHSSDASGEIAQAWVAEQPRTTYIRLSRNCGSHAAIAAGLKFSTGDCAVIMASDLQDPPEVIPKLLERWREGKDVVWACRSQRVGESLATRAASKMYYRLMQWMALPEMPPQGADFLLISRKVIDACNAICEKHTSFLAMILWMGFRQTSVEYVKQARQFGKSKWTLSKKLKLFVDSIVSFSYVPIRLMSLLGLLMAAGGFVYALAVVVGRLTGWVAAGTGFAALMTVLLVGQGAILIMLGILGEYLWRTFDEARGRPKYIIEEYVTSNKTEPEPHRSEKTP
jgi:dolichol-phosphate mannosyltransferase